MILKFVSSWTLRVVHTRVQWTDKLGDPNSLDAFDDRYFQTQDQTQRRRLVRLVGKVTHVWKTSISKMESSGPNVKEFWPQHTWLALGSLGSRAVPLLSGKNVHFQLQCKIMVLQGCRPFFPIGVCIRRF